MAVVALTVHTAVRDGQPPSGLGRDERPPPGARPSRARHCSRGGDRGAERPGTARGDGGQAGCGVPHGTRTHNEGQALGSRLGRPPRWPFPGPRPTSRTASREEVLPMKVARGWVDPFDDMSDEDFDAHVGELFAAPPATVAVSLRMAPDLLGRAKREAARAGMPYQTFIKGILEAGLSRLERRGLRAGRSARTTTQRKARRPAV